MGCRYDLIERRLFPASNGTGQGVEDQHLPRGAGDQELGPNRLGLRAGAVQCHHAAVELDMAAHLFSTGQQVRKLGIW